MKDEVLMFANTLDEFERDLRELYDSRNEGWKDGKGRHVLAALYEIRSAVLKLQMAS